MEETIIGIQSVGIQATAKHYSKFCFNFSSKLKPMHHVYKDRD